MVRTTLSIAAMILCTASLTSAVVAPVPRGLVPMPKSVPATEAAGPGFPSFLPAECGKLLESEARTAFMQLRRTTVPVELDAAARCDVPTTFWATEARNTARTDIQATLSNRLRLEPLLLSSMAAGATAFATDTRAKFGVAAGGASSAPRVLLLHGADASIMEWRFLVPRLSELGVSSVAVDWWSGGFTEREGLLEQLDAASPGPGPVQGTQPWDVVQQHLFAFWKKELRGQPVIVVGASLGGAVALDFAARFPEAVAGLVRVRPESTPPCQPLLGRCGTRAHTHTLSSRHPCPTALSHWS